MSYYIVIAWTFSTS